MATIVVTTEPPVDNLFCDDRCELAKWYEWCRCLDAETHPPVDYRRMCCPLHSRLAHRRMTRRDLHLVFEDLAGIPAHDYSSSLMGSYPPFAFTPTSWQLAA